MDDRGRLLLDLAVQITEARARIAELESRFLTMANAINEDAPTPPAVAPQAAALPPSRFDASRDDATPAAILTSRRSGTQRGRVVNFFLSHRGARYTPRELSKILQIPIGSVYSQVSALTTNGEIERLAAGVYRMPRKDQG